MLDLIANFLKSNPVSILSLIVSIVALRFSYVSWKKTRTATLYSDIDGRYMELLKLGISNPSFVNPALTKEYKTKFPDDKLLQYERYAFAAWNIVETIVDRCKETQDTQLSETWYPVIKEENSLHRCWLNNKENKEKFKDAFWDFMIGNEKFPCPDCEGKSLCPRCSELRATIQPKGKVSS
jgi:hypothetical protein